MTQVCHFISSFKTNAALFKCRSGSTSEPWPAPGDCALMCAPVSLTVAHVYPTVCREHGNTHGQRCCDGELSAAALQLWLLLKCWPSCRYVYQTTYLWSIKSYYAKPDEPSKRETQNNSIHRALTVCLAHCRGLITQCTVYITADPSVLLFITWLFRRAHYCRNIRHNTFKW